VEYPIGAGWLIAFGQPLETSHYWGWDAGLILENTLIWGHEYHPRMFPGWIHINQQHPAGQLERDYQRLFRRRTTGSKPAGAYLANLRIDTDSPYGALLLPVTMNINHPAIGAS